MSVKINLPLSSDWKVSTEITRNEEGEEVTSLYATCGKASIELYAGAIPDTTNAQQECINSYAEAFDVKKGEPVEIGEIPFMGTQGWYYDAEDETGAPVILICVEPRKGTLVMAILADENEDKLDDLMSLVDENLTVE